MVESQFNECLEVVKKVVRFGGTEFIRLSVARYLVKLQFTPTPIVRKKPK